MGRRVQQGEIQVIFGPMFSGKTTEMMRRCRKYQFGKYKCLLVKYAKDTRYSQQDEVATHDKQVLPAIPAVKLRSIMIQMFDFDVIGIDEGQFFPDIVECSEELANSGKTVIIAALDGTFQRECFGPILNLIPKAESVTKLRAVCMMCYGDASYTKRMSSDTEVEVIGGSDKYMAVCRECYIKSSTKQSTIVSPCKRAYGTVLGKENEFTPAKLFVE